MRFGNFTCEHNAADHDHLKLASGIPLNWSKGRPLIPKVASPRLVSINSMISYYYSELVSPFSKETSVKKGVGEADSGCGCGGEWGLLAGHYSIAAVCFHGW